MIYFAFGSNMDTEQMKVRCPSHKVLGRAYLADHDLCFPRQSKNRKCGTAGISPIKGKGIWGVLYELDERDLVRLHKEEGYKPGRPREKNSHNVIDVEVCRDVPEGESVLAITYLPRPDESGAMPSQEYIDQLVRGAESHRLPKDYVKKLRSIQTSEAAGGRKSEQELRAEKSKRK